MCARLELGSRIRIETEGEDIIQGPLALILRDGALIAQLQNGGERIVRSQCDYDLDTLLIMISTWDDSPVNSAHDYMVIPFTLN